MDIKLYIMMGLPGSGKTTCSEELAKKVPSYRVCLLHLDELRSGFRYSSKATLREMIGGELNRGIYKDLKHVILDGPIFTNEDLFQAITATAPSFDKVDVTVYHWNEDRETCLKNDGGRRDVSSATTILNAPYEEVDADGLNERLKGWDAQIVKVIPKTVCLKDGWERHFRHCGVWISDDKKLRGDKWCTGGSYGNCWNNRLTPVTPDKPLEFSELDRLLTDIAPNITFLQYKRILNECTDKEESYNRDYYGGGTSYLNWVCDLQKLDELLEEFGYVSE